MPKLHRLREIREARWMTQAELAEKSGLVRSTIIRLENGEDAPYARTVRRLAHALRVPPEDLVGEPSGVPA
jgi:transcriptional regulator with XRE-family HTH domain